MSGAIQVEPDEADVTRLAIEQRDQARDALLEIARSAQGSVDTGLPLDRDWVVTEALRGRGELPEDDDEPAKVIIVTDDTGRDRRYAADEWQAEEAVDVLRKGEVIVTYPQGTWRRATVEGAELAGVRPTAIRLQSALRQVVMADDGTPAEVLQHIARTELERSGWDEDDL